MKLDEKMVAALVTQKIISVDQENLILKKMKDWAAEKSSNRWTIAILTIGALLLGLAAIIFISSNWEELSRWQKLSLAIGITFTTLSLGVYFAYIRTNLPKFGKILIFLSTILFGGTLALISQVYHLSGSVWGLFALWGIGIFPLAYFFQSNHILRLFLVIFCTGVIFYLTGADSVSLEEAFGSSFLNIPLLIMVMMFLFAVGNIHKLLPTWEEFGVIYRMWGIKITFFLLFWLTFGEVFDEISRGIIRDMEYLGVYWVRFLLFLVLSLLLIGTWIFKTNKPSREITTESVFYLMILGFNSFYFWILTQSVDLDYSNYSSLLTENSVLVILANLIFMGGLFIFLYEAYRRNNMSLLNFALFGTGIFIFSKYIQFFHDLMEMSLFFFIGGVVLVTLGVFLEKYRRTLKTKWT